MAAVVAILNEQWCWSLKGTFLQSPSISQKKIGPVNPGVRQIIDGNQFQDGGSGGHIENRNTQIFKRNLPLLTPNIHTLKIDSIRQAVLLEIEGNDFQDGDWRPN
jgi:hypothetical protein